MYIVVIKTKDNSMPKIQLAEIACPACGNLLTKKEALDLYAQVHSMLLKGKTTPKKSAAARENGKKGGRPRKQKSNDIQGKGTRK